MKSNRIIRELFFLLVLVLPPARFGSPKVFKFPFAFEIFLIRWLGNVLVDDITYEKGLFEIKLIRPDLPFLLFLYHLFTNDQQLLVARTVGAFPFDHPFSTPKTYPPPIPVGRTCTCTGYPGWP